MNCCFTERMMTMEQSPCKTCTKVELPYDCERKGCGAWRKWFFARWKEINGFYEKYRKENDNARDDI